MMNRSKDIPSQHADHERLLYDFLVLEIVVIVHSVKTGRHFKAERHDV